MKKPRRLLSLLFFITVAIFTILRLRKSQSFPKTLHDVPYGRSDDPQPIKTHPGSHPILELVADAEKEFEKVKARQSKTLSDAVAEYRRRYGMAPPPNFDKWFHFAKKRNVQMIDEYDTIHQSLLPFWGAEPAVLRERVRKAIGYDNAMIAVKVRHGAVVSKEGGGEMYEWHRNATPVMLEEFVQYLPDMDLAYNIHDEPRIVLQHDELNRYVETALNKNIPKISRRSGSNRWLDPPSDIGPGETTPRYETTSFNKFAHQATWSNSLMSCSIDSAARNCTKASCPDNVSAYTKLPLGLIQNTTAFSDICNSPSLETSFGFFDRPNAFDIAHELIPVFSQSKVSSFQDILYPSPWYYMGKVTYKARRDYNWDDKNTTMFWRGSTTGGYSRNGGWRRQHRQRFIQKLHPSKETSVLRLDARANPSHPVWLEEAAIMGQYTKYFDVKFTSVLQCDAEDCAAQEEEFTVVDKIDMYDALGAKFLLDIDGNAFSGRYYAWLLSNSLVFKLSLFREWHDEWIRPWVHYIPLSLKGGEYAEMMRYFSEDSTGRPLAKRLAEQGQTWAEKVLRPEDMEAWYFRLLLEYGRVIDDHRYELGFSL